MRLRRNHLRVSFLILGLVIGSTSFIPSQSVSAATCDYEFFALNNITGYDACSDTCSVSSTTGGLTTPAPSSLTGTSNVEKTWNYLTNRGLTPVAAAGAMGNMEQESPGMNPFMEEDKEGGNKGLGIVQWTGNRRTKLEAAASSAGISLSDTSTANNDKALLFQLNYLWGGEDGTSGWQGQVNSETSVDGDTAIASYNDEFSASLRESQSGNGSTMLFHALIERSGDTPNQLKIRIANAHNFLDQFASGGSATGCSVGAGGLTLKQARKVMDYYRDNETRESLQSIGFPSYFLTSTEETCGSDSTPSSHHDPSLISDVLANCTAFSSYFVSKYTSLNNNATGNGNAKISGYENRPALGGINPDIDQGNTPQVFAIFEWDSGSNAGHTGVVLGIEPSPDGNPNNAKVIVGEAGCGYGYEGIGVNIYADYTVGMMSSGKFNFLYAGEAVNTQALMGIANG